MYPFCRKAHEREGGGSSDVRKGGMNIETRESYILLPTDK